MALESATYINGLVTSNPPAGDPVAQAADHLRLLKATIKTTFPNVAAAVTPTAQALNDNLVPVGAVMIWPGSVATIPAGWGYCNGSTYAKLDGSGNVVAPDYRDKFLVSAGTTYTPGATGGAASFTPTITNTGVALSQANLPNYNLPVGDPGHAHTIYDPGHAHSYSSAVGSTHGSGVFGSAVPSGANTTVNLTGIGVNLNYTGVTVNSGGSGTAHNHAASSNAVPTLPPYIAAVFMMKL